MTTSFILIVLLLVLLMGGVWIAVTLGIVAWAGVAFFSTTRPEINLFTSYWNTYSSLSLASLPLFIWMGEILFRTRLVGADVPRPGAVAGQAARAGCSMCNVLGCGIFGSVSGSSAATCATIAKIALPELRKRGYDERMALGSLARRGHARHPDPALDHDDRVRGRGRRLDHPHVHGRRLPGLLLMGLFSGYIVVWALLQPGHACRRASIRMSAVRALSRRRAS